MRRRAPWLAAFGLLLAGAVWADEPPSPVDPRGGEGGRGPTQPAFGHDPDCPGCQAFLAGGKVEGPTCSVPTGGTPPGSWSLAGGTSGAGTGATGASPLETPAPALARQEEAEEGFGDELFAADSGTGYGYESAAPGMIGDFFGGSFQMLVTSAGQTSPSNVSIAGGDRRFKIAENYSPFPVDRVFFNYNHFHNALITADGRDAHFNRGILGAESTFLDRMMSLEIRLPFGSGLNGDQQVAATADNVANEFGNISLALKGLLLQRDTLAVSAGVGLVLPTGPDTHLYGPGVSGLFMTIENEAIYLQPFLGAFWTPTDRFFVQLAGQIDIDACGNTVDFTFIPTPREGVIQDQSLLFLDASFGYWLFRDLTNGAAITGLAPMLELHYNTTLEDSDTVDAGDTGFSTDGSDIISNFRNRLDVLNLTGALRIEIAGRSYLTVFGVAPLRPGDDKMFDAEFGVQYSRMF